jgi:ATP-dependent Lhr-like helicase
MEGDNHHILVSRTASGKTEAAFLPILSKVNFKDPGVQVLYISPLIALINDQFQRVEALCQHLDVTVTKWHGEANQTAKKRLLKNPEGVLLITPESIEALFVNHPYNARILFAHLRYIVIDEIHTFLGNDRGIQLKSLISRINGLFTGSTPRVVALSATLGDYNEPKHFTGDPEHTIVLRDKTAKSISAYFKYSPGNDIEYCPTFIEELYEHVKDNKVLIFPNNRGNAEEIAVKLKKLSERKKGHPYFFSHHSSVDKEVREYIEDFVKNNKRNNFCIACTSTLELGIDIGTVDTVIQVDAAHSIASLIQRVGRSGRREGQESKLLLYATNGWDLLQSLACWKLFKEEFIEPVVSRTKPYDLIFHQALSILKETNGIPKPRLTRQLLNNTAFKNFDESEIIYLLDYMIKAEYIEDINRELIVGYEGEKLTSSRDFYSTFVTPAMLKVIHAGKSIGELEFSTQVEPGRNILLAARIWKIRDVDLKARKVFVSPANDGKKPLYLGNGPDVHPRVRQKMLELINKEIDPEEAHETAILCLKELSLLFKDFDLDHQSPVRPVIRKDSYVNIYTFTGTKINRTLLFLIKTLNIKVMLQDERSMIRIESKDVDLDNLIANLKYNLPLIQHHVRAKLEEEVPGFIFNKWGQYLPLDLKTDYILKTDFDIPGTTLFLSELELVTPITGY